MKHLQKLIEQVEKTKQRHPATPGSQKGSHNYVKSKSIIDPKQVALYLQENDLNLVRLISDPLLRERVISGDDTLDVNYMQNGANASKPVCRITIRSSDGEEGYGTGFLIAPQILITNNHVRR